MQQVQISREEIKESHVEWNTTVGIYLVIVPNASTKYPLGRLTTQTLVDIYQISNNKLCPSSFRDHLLITIYKRPEKELVALVKILESNANKLLRSSL